MQCPIKGHRCNSHIARERKFINKKQKLQATPARKKAPVSLTSPDRILLTLRQQREENASLQDEICKLKNEISSSAVHVDQNLHNDLQSILSETLEKAKNQRKISPFMELFLKHQMDYLTEHPTQ